MMFSCARAGADMSPRTDRILCGDGFMISNYDGVTKALNTRTITIGTGEEARDRPDGNRSGTGRFDAVGELRRAGMQVWPQTMAAQKATT